MNQEIVVGVGNIYANELLFLAHISPLRKSSTLSKSECQKLIQAKGVKSGPSRLDTFFTF